MNLTKYSQNLLMSSFERWKVDRDFADPMYNYLVHGFSPGGCFTAVLANDFHGAISRSHPVNTIQAFKALSGWMINELPLRIYGSYGSVNNWLAATAEQRRACLEQHGLIYTEQEEMMLILQDAETPEPFLW